MSQFFVDGRLGTPIDGRSPWLGKESMEKAIFVFALVTVCDELGLPPQNGLRHYNVDVPTQMMAGRSLSIPIYLDIKSHFMAGRARGKAPFGPEEEPPLLQRVVLEESLIMALSPGEPRPAEQRNQKRETR
jgi:hypothetical protein